MLFQVPTASVTVDGSPALNRVRWAQSGREIAVGDSDGRVLVYDVGEVRLIENSTHSERILYFVLYPIPSNSEGQLWQASPLSAGGGFSRERLRC